MRPWSTFEVFRPELMRAVPRADRSKGGRPLFDHVLMFKVLILQIPPTPLRPHQVRATVRVHEYPDGSLAIFQGPRRLASLPPAAPAPAEQLAA